MTDKNSDRLWKMRNLFEILNKKFSKFYSPSEHLAIDEVIKYKHKRFGIKIYKLCDKIGYTYDMTVYLGTDRQCTVQHLTATHASVGIDKENKRTWPQTVYGQLPLLPQLIQ